MKAAPGDSVFTEYGTGVTIRCHDNGWTTIRVNRVPGKSIASGMLVTVRDECVTKKLIAASGMIVRGSNNGIIDGAEETTMAERKYMIEDYCPEKDVYLASIITINANEEGIDNGHSLAKSLAVISSPMKSIEENANIREGGEQQHEQQQSSSNEKSKTTVEITADQIDPSSTSAKFYPMLEDLMRRGENAWSSSSLAEVTQNTKEQLDDNDEEAIANKLLSSCTVTIDDKDGGDNNNDDVAKLISGASKSSMDAINEKISAVAASSPERIAQTTAAAKTVTEGISLPEADEIRQVYDMLRDEDLTKLFQLGRERLRDLVEVEVPEKTKKALEAMGIELDDGEEISATAAGQTIRQKMSKLQKEALESMEKMLATISVSDDQIAIQGSDGQNTTINFDGSKIIGSIPQSPTEQLFQAKEQFAKVFDQLSSVATSDPQLLSIFSSISEKTKLWQEMTGRIFQTKTISLFMEGSQRLQARAAQLLNLAPDQIRGLGGSGDGSGSNLTRAFTEGDVAMAKLKSLEMGDAIRSRLFAAIELRSESSGGLDGIISGSLTAISKTGDEYSAKAASLLGTVEENGTSMSLSGGLEEQTINSVISRLQSSATSAMKGTKETLIALLSGESMYRDAVLLRLEQVFLDLESQLGQELSAEEIAQLASGEGGTMSLFKPVAMKAAKDIELHLDTVEKKMKESKHWNSKADDALEKVRQITSGELSMTDIVDMAAGFLDDEDVVAKSGGLIVKAESLLDDFEAASGKLGAKAAEGDATAGIMQAVTKAGITKETVMKGVEGLDVNKLLDDTQSVMTDERARREMISSAGDAALDFLLKILPSMPVPPFDGVREGLVYHLSNLSMAGFKVKKEDIHIEIAGIRASTTEDMNGDTVQPSKAVKASELLIIDIKNISATLDDAFWSFEQTYMPYLKGSGKANTKLWDGAIRLKFELRRRIADAGDDADDEKDAKWEPVLCLNDRFCSIGGIELLIQGESRLAWAANKLASLLKNPLRDYVVSVIITALKNNSGWLIDTLNQSLSPYWDFVLRTAGLELKSLPKLARHHVTKADSINEDEVELVWRERLPLGLNILTNDKSGYLKVIDLPRGTQARKVAQDKKLDPDIFKGSMIVSVNGKRYGPDNQVDLFAALKDPSRPKSILFKLASDDDVLRIKKLMERSNHATTSGDDGQSLDNVTDSRNLITTVEIVNEGDIGIKFASSPDNFGLSITGFARDTDGKLHHHGKEMSRISENDLLCSINGISVLGEKGEGKQKALSLLEQVGNKRPLSLSFVKPYIHTIVFEMEEDYGSQVGGPSELSLTQIKSASSSDNKIVLGGFVPAEGAAEKNNVFIGDNLAFVNGIPVGAGCRLLQGSGPPPKLFEVIDMMKQQSPMALTFARAQSKKTSGVKSYLTSSPLSLDIESAETFSIAAANYSQLGCSFTTGYNGTDVVVKSINGVEGPLQYTIKKTQLPLIGCKLEAVDGEPVPNYATPQLVMNAMSRRWAADNRLELTFCNETHRDSIRKLKDSN